MNYVIRLFALATSILCCFPQNLSSVGTDVCTLHHPHSGQVVTIIKEYQIFAQAYLPELFFDPTEFAPTYKKLLDKQLQLIEDMAHNYDCVISQGHVPPEWLPFDEVATPRPTDPYQALIFDLCELCPCSLFRLMCEKNLVKKMSFFDPTIILLSFCPADPQRGPAGRDLQEALWDLWLSEPAQASDVMLHIALQLMNLKKIIIDQLMVMPAWLPQRNIFVMYLGVLERLQTCFEITDNLTRRPSDNFLTQEYFQQCVSGLCAFSFTFPTLQSILSSSDSHLILALPVCAQQLCDILLEHGFILVDQRSCDLPASNTRATIHHRLREQITSGNHAPFLDLLMPRNIA